MFASSAAARSSAAVRALARAARVAAPASARSLATRVLARVAAPALAARVPHAQIRAMSKQSAEGEEPFSELERHFLDPETFFQAVNSIGIKFFCGVPDSLLKDFCAYVTDKAPKGSHIITSNEGAAIALAAGHYMATRQPAMVYLQNSGLGNTVNPLMSLAHREVYSIPMLLMVGWRGEPGKKDEPQHTIQGEITPSLLATMQIPFAVLPDYIEGAEKVLQTARHYMQTSEGPFVLLVKRRTFDSYKLPKAKSPLPLNREEALGVLLPCLGSKDIVVGTTGMLSRELYELRVKLGMGHEKDFLTVGSMGFASSIALGVANAKPKRRVVCLDGDGAVLMHMGTLTTNAAYGTGNLKHVVFNNGAHDSVGGQPTVAAESHFDLKTIALGCGYKKVWVASTAEEIKESYAELAGFDGAGMLEIKIRPGGARKDLGRPKSSPVQNKTDFMMHTEKTA